MLTAVILTYNRFPNGDAGSIRQEAFAKLLKIKGYSVTVIGMGEYTGSGVRQHKGLRYLSFRNRGCNLISRIINVLGYRRKLKNYLENTRPPDLILVVQIPITALLLVKKFATRNGILLIHDSVEWYSPEQFALGKLSVSYIGKDLYNTRLIDRSFKVIAISSLLDKHFKSRGLQSVVIPVVMDSDGIDHSKSLDEKVVSFLYAGSPGRKDSIKEIIEGFCVLPQHLLGHVRLKIIGITLEQLVKSGVSEKSITFLQSSLQVMGRTSRDEVLQHLKAVDFTLLLRPPNLRYANAGFPTKVVESLMTGTPVICNITSDLGKYIIDMQNGIIVNEFSTNSLAQSILKALRLTPEERSIMQRKARESAERYFDYRKYEGELGILLERPEQSDV